MTILPRETGALWSPARIMSRGESVMRVNRRWVLAAAAAAAVTLPLGVVHDARADVAPPLDCGSPANPGPCQQTAHFSDVDNLGSPLPGAPSNCPGWLSTDYVRIAGTGNGVEHVTVNKADDFWFTTTFTGHVTLTGYAPDQVDATDPNNPVLVAGATPDPAAAPYSGKLTNWFGASGNRQSAVFHGTGTVSASAADGSSVHVHFQAQQSYTPGADLSGPPSHQVTHVSVTC